MQKINIKKYTKEQMLKMLEEALDKQEAAETEANVLRAKLTETEKALDVVSAQYKSADHSAAMLRSRIDEAEKMRDQALEAHGEDMKAIEKAKNESRELAHLLGKRELELAEAKQRHDDAMTEAAHLRGELKAAEDRAARKEELLCGALHTIKTERSIKEDYHESLKWCMAHPWRNVWRCMKEYFRF
jgi:DNA repair exonuclease SbcCD ATPase subunit